MPLRTTALSALLLGKNVVSESHASARVQFTHTHRDRHTLTGKHTHTHTHTHTNTHRDVHNEHIGDTRYFLTGRAGGAMVLSEVFCFFTALKSCP